MGALETFKAISTKRKNIFLSSIGAILETLCFKYVDFHNALLLNKSTHIGPEWVLFPFVVDKDEFVNGSKRNLQYTITESSKEKFSMMTDDGDYNVLTESKVHRVCRDELKKDGQWTNPRMRQYLPKCRLIHHFSPYLKLGPFHLEIYFYEPFRGIFHDFLSEKEM